VNSKATVTIGDLFLNYTYEINAFVRNAAGSPIYTGAAQFVNNGSSTSIVIPMAKI
jgi:hypothetical protein